MDPRVRVAYLVGVAVGAFLVRDWRVGVALFAAHVIAWLGLRLGVRALFRQVFKLWGFALLVVGTYAVTPDDPAHDRWIAIPLGSWTPHLNIGAALIGAQMVLRVVTVILASQIARAGDTRAIAVGIRKLGAPPIVAASLDAVLALLGGGGGGGGGGRGGGRGRNREPVEGGFWGAIKRLARGDVGIIAQRIERHIARAEAYVAEEHGDLGRELVRDIAVIAGVSLTMLGIKALKILPSIPFAPGHKLVLLTPLYIVAALKTRSKIGATWTGLVMGTVAFLMGDGKYGILEIAKHVAPGFACDALVPLLFRGRTPGVFSCSLLGGVMGLGRVATIFLAMVAAGPPKLAFAFLVPGLIVHTSFGIISGLVSAPLVRRVAERPSEEAEAPRVQEEAKAKT